MRLLIPIFLFVLALVTGCAADGFIPPSYTSPDAGIVVVGIGTTPGTFYQSYQLLFRERSTFGSADSSTPQGAFAYHLKHLMIGDDLDYQTSAETGVVVVRSLPPGDYEIYDAHILRIEGAGSTTYSAPAPVSIPFTVRSHQTTYIGNYQAHGLHGHNMLGLPMYFGAVFAIEDRSAADLTIARAKASDLPESVSDMTPDPRSLRSPMFLTPQAAQAVH